MKIVKYSAPDLAGVSFHFITVKRIVNILVADTGHMKGVHLMGNSKNVSGGIKKSYNCYMTYNCYKPSSKSEFIDAIAGLEIKISGNDLLSILTQNA